MSAQNTPSTGVRGWNPESLKLESRNRLQAALAARGTENAVKIPFAVLVGRTRKPQLLIISGVHGDEYEGPAVLQDLAAELDPSELNGTLILVPVANPLAFEQGVRRTPGDQADLNRIFPGDPDGTISYRLADLLFREFVEGADSVLSMHGWSKEGDVLPYAEYQDADSEIGRHSFETACALGLPYVHPYSWPGGELGGAALRAGVPVVEIEVGGLGTISPSGQVAARKMIDRFLEHEGMIGATGSPAGAIPKIVRHVEVVAHEAGLLRANVEIGQQVAQGELLGTIASLAGDCVEEVRSPRVGVVAVWRKLASVQPGHLLAQIFYWD